jgi:hypothetical protein
MSILTKVLIGLVVVAVFPLIFFSAAVLKVQKSWRSEIDKFQKAVDRQQAENYDRIHGDRKARVERYEVGKLLEGKEGIKQREVALENLKLGRGRFWYALSDANLINAAGSTMKVKLVDESRADIKGQHGIKDKAFLYLFQIKHDIADQTNIAGNRYLGEFVVEGLQLDANGVPTDNLLPLKPSHPLTQAQWDDLARGNDNWILYEYMPVDDHDVFSDLTEDEIRAILPNDVENEYVYDDKEPTDAVLNDPKLKLFVIEDPDTGAKKFLRPLRDYQQIFRNAALRMTEINDRLVVVKKEKEYADRAKTQAEALNTALDARKAKLDAEKAVLEKELAIVKAHAQKLDALLVQVQQDLKTRLAENRALADEMAGRGKAKTAALFSPDNAAAQTP